MHCQVKRIYPLESIHAACMSPTVAVIEAKKSGYSTAVLSTCQLYNYTMYHYTCTMYHYIHVQCTWATGYILITGGISNYIFPGLC